MLQGEHSAILWTFIKLPFVVKIFVLSTFEWPLKTGFTVYFFVFYETIVERLVMPPMSTNAFNERASGETLILIWHR